MVSRYFKTVRNGHLLCNATIDICTTLFLELFAIGRYVLNLELRSEKGPIKQDFELGMCANLLPWSILQSPPSLSILQAYK